MEKKADPDPTNRNILRILSSYTQLTPLQLWYALGEDHRVKERLREEEIVSRLEGLMAEGFVEVVTSGGKGCKQGVPGYCVKPPGAGKIESQGD